MSQPATSDIHIFGVRHHGPGSARSLRRALHALRPDAILVEGPPDAAEVLELLAHTAMRPPVALLIYAPDEPRRAVYYPFAIFSPEWQALHYGLTNGIPVRFMDLPQAHQLALRPADDGPPTTDDRPQDENREPRTENQEPEAEDRGSRIEDSHPEAYGTLPSNRELVTENQKPKADGEDAQSLISNLQSPISKDPLGWLAAAAGYSDGERWWEHMVEQRRDSGDLFAAILEAMAALREAAPPEADLIEVQREAWMRQTIRAAQREGFKRIAVVCGAWHGPALARMPAASADAAVLKSLPKIKVQATWVPWTYGRLSYASGYGAGIESPGWYEHLWKIESGAGGIDPVEVTTRWMARAARLLREEDLDASAAHVIEAVRLAETLAALRERPLPGLPEMNEAAQAVFCFGGDLPMRLIHDRLIVGETLGQVPDETPMVPLQQDLLREQRRLRMPAEASWRDYDLDQRKPNDLQRSYLLHRLKLLGIEWGKLQRSGGQKGTFHELWRVQWQPELAVALIDAGIWGNTIVDAATAYARAAAERAGDLPALTKLVDQALLADLTDAVTFLMGRLQDEAALASDVAHLMEALPPLVDVLRYGNVRKTDAGAVGHVVDGLVARICIGLPGACASLNDDAAAAMFERLTAVNQALKLNQNADHLAAWHATLRQMADQQGLHGLLAGRCCHILLDTAGFDSEEAERRMRLALAPAAAPAQAAAWVEGLLKGSGSLLLHDDRLWQILDGWVAALAGDAFTLVLPLLRRTFATFAAPERRQMGERARSGPARRAARQNATSDDSDPTRGAAVLPLVAQLLGLNT